MQRVHIHGQVSVIAVGAKERTLCRHGCRFYGKPSGMTSGGRELPRSRPSPRWRQRAERAGLEIQLANADQEHPARAAIGGVHEEEAGALRLLIGNA